MSQAKDDTTGSFQKPSLVLESLQRVGQNVSKSQQQSVERTEQGKQNCIQGVLKCLPSRATSGSQQLQPLDHTPLPDPAAPASGGRVGHVHSPSQ